MRKQEIGECGVHELSGETEASWWGVFLIDNYPTNQHFSPSDTKPRDFLSSNWQSRFWRVTEP